MTKPFKLRLHLPSFQLCRSISSSVLANGPSSTHPLIPVNSKALDTIITYPMTPAPPPSSPDHSSCKRNVASKIIPIGLDSKGSRSFRACVASINNMESPANGYDSTFEKLYNSPEASAEFDDGVSNWPIASSNAEKSRKEESIWLKEQSATSFTACVSPAESGWFSSEDEDEDDDGAESEGDQSSSCSSFSSACDLGHPLKKTTIDHESTNANGRKIKKKEGKVRRLRSYASNDWKDGEKIKVATATMLPESDSSGRKTVLGRLLPCMVDGKVNESYAIMKKSEEPFDDFKVSMLEMIQEKHLSEAEDLEKLLMCFLSLNAKIHHAVIVAAFTQVWEELYSS